jgi:Kdo2-lipid IVA lauroyltransferase/acyltransferase
MLSLLAWLSRRSLGFLHALGAVLGWLSYALSPSYRRRLQANADRAGIRAAVRRASVAQAGRMVAETPLLWLRAELIEQALGAGHGLVLLTPHLGCFEVIAQAYAEHFGARQPMTALYRPARQPWLRELEQTARNRPGLLTAPASLAGVRQMIRALRQGQTVGLLPDQVPPEGMGVWAPFFGELAYTMTLGTRLVEQTGAAWLLVVGERLPSSRGWRVCVFEPPEQVPARGEAMSDEDHQTQCAAMMNRCMEWLIAKCPDQYLWGYHRYKAPKK